MPYQVRQEYGTWCFHTRLWSHSAPLWPLLRPWSPPLLLGQQHPLTNLSSQPLLSPSHLHGTGAPLLLFQNSRLVLLGAGRMQPDKGALAISTCQLSKKAAELSKPRLTSLLRLLFQAVLEFSLQKLNWFLILSYIKTYLFSTAYLFSLQVYFRKYLV